MIRPALVLAVALLAACQPKAPEAAAPAATDTATHDAAAHAAHEAYVQAINANNIDTFAAVLSEDAVRAWAEEYLQAYKTNWEKTVQDFVVSGDYAVERYSYKSTDTPAAGGAAMVDTGWGLVVYHRAADGKWLVARDAFAPDHPPAPAAT